ncbi:DnaB-like helicase N-terminal domain-containing protein [Streptomyces sp. NPDC006925]|uniref:DnaB-like helicase N-terminal domain-containing protein n=1 Tax=Streptomyces sp. NPDC006925 TaxID=3364768 RepID=UPI0036CBB232
MTRLTRRAEEALLGAALFRPEILPAMQWVPPGAFSRPDHGALWRTLHAIDFSRVPRAEIPAVVTRAVERIEDRGIRNCLSPQRLQQLAGACPNPRTAALYGGMTVEGGVHRAVEDTGDRLRAAAQQADVEQAGDTVGQAQVARERFASLHQAWLSTPEQVRVLLDTQHDQRLPEPEAQQARRPERLDLQAEFDVVASLQWDSRQVGDIPWLQDQDFADPALRTAYGAITALHERQSPVDDLTVAWEAARRGGPQPSEQLLADLARHGSGGIAAHAGARVLSTAALDRLETAGEQVRDAGRAPALAPSALVVRAEQSLQPSLTDERRIHHAEREPELADGKEPSPPAHPAREVPAPSEMEM